MRTVSIVIPAYNEAAFIGELLEHVRRVPTEDLGFDKEIIVVDDGSADETAAIASAFEGVRVIRQENQGKGAAVQRGVAEATGDFVLVQDADLEYDPQDYLPMLRKIGDRERIAIYGSRPKGVVARRGLNLPFPGRHERQDLGPWGMNIILSAMTRAIYRQPVSDPLTAYKIYPTSFLRSIDVVTAGFETDHELTAKLAHAGIPIEEVPIGYDPRTAEEGKKIRARDGLIAVQTLWRFRRP